VILLSEDGSKRAEGTLVTLAPTRNADKGIQQYDIPTANLHGIP
jgi:hypothetical protein